MMVLLAVGMMACTEQNTPSDPTGSTTDTTTVSPGDTTMVSADTIKITWNGTAATIEGSHSGVSVSETNGYVTVNSTVKDMTYLLRGNGQGQLTIYGTNRHQLILSDLTLACSDGPAINNQCKKSCFVVLEGTNSLSDGASYADSDEDRKAAFFSEGQMIFSGGGSLSVTGAYKHALASDDYIQFAQSTGTLTLTAANDGLHANDGIYIDGGTFSIKAESDGIQCDSLIIINDGTITISAGGDGIQSDTASVTVNGGAITITKAGDKGITAFGDIIITDGTLRITSEYKCLKAGKKENNTITSAGKIDISGGDIQCICTGTSSGGWGNTDTSSPEAIEAKGTLTISGGYVYAQASDDAINCASDLTISGGYVCAYSTGNDGIDANGNLYVQGGFVYAIGSRSPEVALDANTEGGKKLYIQGGTIVAVGDLESGASITGGTCKYTSSWNGESWYALYNGSEIVAAFKTPTKSSSSNWAPPGGGGGGPGGGGGSSNLKLVVYTSSTPALQSGVSVSGGSAILNGMVNPTGSISGGSSVSLSNYSSGSGW